MKKLLLVLTLGAAMLSSHSASAGGRFFDSGFSHWGGNNFYRGGFYRPTYSGVYDFNRWDRGWNRGLNRGWDRGWNRGWGRGNVVNISYGNFDPFWGRPWGRPWRGRGFDGGAFVGGVVLGSLISNSARDPGHERVVYRTQAPVRTREVIRSTSAPRASTVSSRRRLLRDIEGNCYERSRNSAGDEVRIEIDPSECQF